MAVARTAAVGALRKLSAFLAEVGSAPISFSNGSTGGGSCVSGIDAVGCLRSLRAHVALDGVSWVQSGSVEIAVGQWTACYRSGALIGTLPRASLRSGARFDLLSGEYCLTTPG